MYKTIIAILVLVLALGGFAFAGNLPTADYNGKEFKFTPANNVEVDYYAGPGGIGAGLNQNFAITSKNRNGNRIFSTTNNTTSIWYQESDTWKGLCIKSGVSGCTQVGSPFTAVTTPGYSSYASPWAGL